MANLGTATGGSILDECRAIDLEIDAVDRNLEQLRLLQQQTLGDVTGGGAAARQLDALSSDTMERYRSLTPRVRAIKSSPEASQPRNAAQVNRVDKRLKGAIQTYQGVEASFRSGVQEQIARQYRIVRPEADEQEVQRAVADERGDVFQRALMQSGRQGKASAALSAVQDRHEQIRKIERQMAELSQLFQDMDAVVVQQGAAVDRIEDQADQTVGDLQGANKQVGIAVDKARAARKKKWICLGICGKYASVVGGGTCGELQLTRSLQFSLSSSLLSSCSLSLVVS